MRKFLKYFVLFAYAVLFAYYYEKFMPIEKGILYFVIGLPFFILGYTLISKGFDTINKEKN